MLVAFTSAMLLMVGLISLTAVVDRMWMLIPVMAIYLTVMAAVFMSVDGLLHDGDDRDA